MRDMRMRFVGITSGSRTNSGEFHQGAGDDGGDCGHGTVWKIAWQKKAGAEHVPSGAPRNTKN